MNLLEDSSRIISLSSTFCSEPADCSQCPEDEQMMRPLWNELSGDSFVATDGFDPSQLQNSFLAGPLGKLEESVYGRRKVWELRSDKPKHLPLPSTARCRI